MRTLATAGDTWGISGPTFLELYAALAIVAIIATILVRRALARSLTPPPAPMAVNPEEVAYLHRGPELAVLAALSALHVAGSIASADRRRLQAVGTVQPEASELELAIHRSAQQPVRRAELPGAQPVAEALGRIERRLIDVGLLLSPEQRSRIRRTGWMLWAVVAVGALRAVAGNIAGRPIGFLLALLAVVAVVATVFSFAAPRRTHRGTAELATLRTAHTSLSPRSRPDWQVYGPGGAALGVAVFGTSALWAAEPAWAKELGVRTPSVGYTGGTGGGGCGGGGGGSCGGGGCGG